MSTDSAVILPSASKVAETSLDALPSVTENVTRSSYPNPASLIVKTILLPETLALIIALTRLSVPPIISTCLPAVMSV